VARSLCRLRIRPGQAFLDALFSAAGARIQAHRRQLAQPPPGPGRRAARRALRRSLARLRQRSRAGGGDDSRSVALRRRLGQLGQVEARRASAAQSTRRRLRGAGSAAASGVPRGRLAELGWAMRCWRYRPGGRAGQRVWLLVRELGRLQGGRRPYRAGAAVLGQHWMVLWG
jgi:hypothetical protein